MNTVISPARKRTAALLTRDRRTTVRRLWSTTAAGLIGSAAVVAVGILWVIVGYIVVRGLPALNWDFFTKAPRPYGEAGGGVAPAITGSLTLLLVASLMAVPIGIGTAIYLAEFGRGIFASVVRVTVDLLAGLPSIVVGAFVWSLVVRRLVGHYSGIAGAIALAIIMIPIIARAVEEVLKLVPQTLREAALALGVPFWRTVLFVVIPAARGGILTAVMLAVARVGGETAPLLLTTLGNSFFNFNLFQPMAALPLQIYLYASSPYDDWHTKAWGASFLLILLIGVLNLLTRFATRGKQLR